MRDTASPPGRGPPQSRRNALQRMTTWLLVGAIAGPSRSFARSPKSADCADLDSLGPDDRRQRELDNYTERSADPGESCGNCRLFTSGASPAECGWCQLFNGPASPRGRCDDWTAKG